MWLAKSCDHPFVVWDEVIPELRTVVSHSLQAHPSLLSRKSQPTPGLPRSLQEGCPCLLHSPSKNTAGCGSPWAEGPGEVQGPL